ncbi:hypothetical protein F4677DRAFT_440283 [Hypoxylon crocopeplum]|nr:hypothetical protein F4677DRAFT_440283 [Hypoxylon crocopeplum]
MAETGSESLSETHTPGAGHWINAVVWVLVSLAAVFLGLRVFCKYKRGRGLWWDDWVLMASWIVLVAAGVITSISVEAAFIEHNQDNKMGGHDVGFLTTITGTLFFIAAAWSKTSFAMTLTRIAGPRLTIVLRVIMISMNGMTCVSVVLRWLQCQPTRRIWDGEAGGTCWNRELILGFTILAAAYSAFLDFVLAVLPWPIIIKLQIRTSEKIGISVAMSMGVCAGVTAIVKCTKFRVLESDEFADNVFDLSIWSAAEIATTVMAASIPVLRALVREVTGSSRRSGRAATYIRDKSRDVASRVKSHHTSLSASRRSKLASRTSDTTSDDRAILSEASAAGRIMKIEEVHVQMGVLDLAPDLLDVFESLTTWMRPWVRVFSFFEELPVPGQEVPLVGSDDVEITGSSKLPLRAHHLVCIILNNHLVAWGDELIGARTYVSFTSRTSAAYMQVIASLKAIFHFGLPAPMQGNRDSAAQHLTVSKFIDGVRRIPEAASGTCNWIFEHDTFRTWLQQKSGILWLQGKPGSGKSTLMRFVADKLLDRPASFGLDSGVSSHFFSFGHGEIRNTENDVIDCLRTHFLACLPREKVDDILGDLSRCSMMPSTQTQLVPGHSASHSTTRYAPLPGPTTIFIDGLDELAEAETVMSYIWAVTSRLPPYYSLRVFVSSRLQPQLEQLTKIRIEDNNTTDIMSYCQALLMTKDVGYRDFLAQEIVSRADGVFLWVKLVVSQLGHIHSKVDFSQVRLPTDLSEAFGWTLDRILENERVASLAESVLKWAIFSRRPLSVCEMMHVFGSASCICSQVCEQCREADGTSKPCFLDQHELSQSHEAVGLEILTYGLLEVVDEMVCFTHYSVKDYLFYRIITQERLEEATMNLPSHAQKSTLSTYPFLKYATYYWMDHLRSSGPVSEDSTSQGVLRDFVAPGSTFRDGWINMYNQFSSRPKRFDPETTTPLHIAGYFNIPLASNEAHKISQYSNVKDHAGRTPLSLACEMGHVELCRNLIMAGADYRIRDEIYGQTALGWAIAQGHKGVVQLLLNHGADPKDYLSRTTPLHLAIRQLDVALVKLLLQNGADAKVLDNHTGESALSFASGLGHTSMINLLLSCGAEVIGKDHGSGWTPLHHAVSQGHLPALEILVSFLSEAQAGELKYHYSSQPCTWVDRVLNL